MCADVIFSCFASQRCMVVSKWFRLRQQWQSYGICISMCHLGFYRNNQHRTLETSVMLWMRHQMVTGSKVWFTRMSTTLSINFISDALCVTNKRITCYLLKLIYLFYIMEKHLELHQQQLKKKKRIWTALLPRLLSPRPAEVRMSRPTGHKRDGDGPLVVGFSAREGEEQDTPLLSRPKRKRRASYMLTAFLSTLFTITDWERRQRRSKHSWEG